jgi:hypothetical protein
VAKRGSSLTDRLRLRDEAIVDFSRHSINRREFMFKMTAAGVSATMAARIGDAVAAPAPVSTSRRWAKQADATIRFVKGVHAPNDAEIWNEMKAAFEAAHPGIVLQPEFYDWATMPEQLTAGYASDSPWDVVYVVDQVLARFVSDGVIADVTAQTSDPAYAEARAGIAPYAWDITDIDGQTYGVGALGAVFNIWYNLDLFEQAGHAGRRDRANGQRDLRIRASRFGGFYGVLGLVPVYPQRWRRYHECGPHGADARSAWSGRHAVSLRSPVGA